MCSSHRTLLRVKTILPSSGRPTFLASEFMTVCAINIVPFILMICKETKSMDAVLIMKIVWLMARPVMEIKLWSITPHECTFSVPVRKAEPRVVATMETLYVYIFFLTVYAGKISPKSGACCLAATPGITGRNSSVAVPLIVGPSFLTYVFWGKVKRIYFNDIFYKKTLWCTYFCSSMICIVYSGKIVSVSCFLFVCLFVCLLRY